MLEVEEVDLFYSKGSKLADWVRLRRPRPFQALNKVSFALHEGEVVGLVGRNGSGKSSLGMLLAGILQPDSGSIRSFGKVQLLSLGLGFNNELSGRENACVNATLLGLSRSEINQRMEDVIDFSGIRDFIDEPIRTYSAGMRSRLAFAVATAIEPDILVLDEVLSTGDDAFRHKAERRMREMRQRAKCVVIVSHSANQIKKLCNRVVWIEAGRVLMDGRPRKVMPAYESFCRNPAKWMERHPDLAAKLQ